MDGTQRVILSGMIAAVAVMSVLVGLAVVYGRSVTIRNVRTFDVEMVRDLLDAAVADDPVALAPIERAMQRLRHSPDKVYLPMAVFRGTECVATNQPDLCELGLDTIRAQQDQPVWQVRDLARDGWTFVAYHDERRFAFDGWFAVATTPLAQWWHGSVDVDGDVLLRKASWPMLWTFLLGTFIYVLAAAWARHRESLVERRLLRHEADLEAARARVAELEAATPADETGELNARLEQLLGDLAAQRESTAALTRQIADERDTQRFQKIEEELADSQRMESRLQSDVDEALVLLQEKEDEITGLTAQQAEHQAQLAEARARVVQLQTTLEDETHTTRTRIQTLERSLKEERAKLQRITRLWSEDATWSERQRAEREISMDRPAQPFTVAMAFIGMEMTLRDRAKAWGVKDVEYTDLLRRAKVPEHEKDVYHRLRGARNSWFHEGRAPTADAVRLLLATADKERYLVPFEGPTKR